MALLENGSSIVFENDRALICISKKDSSVEKIIDKKNDKDLMGESTLFFNLFDENKETIALTNLSLKDDVITLENAVQELHIKVEIFPDFFTFELLDEIVEDKIQGIFLGYAKYEYDYLDKKNVGANGIAMTYSVEPNFYPDAKDKTTKGTIMRRLESKNAKFAIVIAPIIEMKELIKNVYRKVDRKKCIYSEKGGAWGIDCPDNHLSYIVQWESSEDYIIPAIPFYKELGYTIIDIHPSPNKSHRIGDYKPAYYKDWAEFKEKITDVLEKEGLKTELHTYSQYIDETCDTLLTRRDIREDLLVKGTYTLAEDIDEKADFVKSVESTKGMPLARFLQSSPYILIDDELIKFANADDGFKVVLRGGCGTAPAKHKKGAVIRHLDGHHGAFTPRLGSEAFLEVARLTAKAYNEGGFMAIFLDALDGMHRHVPWDDACYYMAMFITELLNHCNTTPVLEYATKNPAIWAGRGKYGAWDVNCHGFRNFNLHHSNSNKEWKDRFGAACMGWNNLYPREANATVSSHVTDNPPNVIVKYYHSNLVHHLGSLGLIHNYSQARLGGRPEHLKMSPGLARNTKIYKKYEDLRVLNYFDDSYLEKARNGQWEYHLKEKEDGKFVLVEKDFQRKRLLDLSEKPVFTNPFKKQKPFIRIEHLLSTKGENPITLLHFDETKDILEQERFCKFPELFDFSEKLALKLKVKGNGIKGSAIAVKLRCDYLGEWHGEYVLDTDFEGWREVTLIETENAERVDLKFARTEKYGSTWHLPIDVSRIKEIEIDYAGDVTGVKMGDVVACDYTFEVLRHPTLKVGDQQVMFECDLASCDFIEFDGERAFVLDKNTNAREIYFEGGIEVDNGDFEAELQGKAYNKTSPRAFITFGFTGEEL